MANGIYENRSKRGFEQLAQAMMDANVNDAVKAFGAAMSKGIERQKKSN